MLEVLNAFGVHVGTIGNHDLDFGTETLAKLIKFSQKLQTDSISERLKFDGF
jgi:2',3'-cyclic-nucleotide 2'-phosphodiesterase (5'-nucleotidase family)